MSASFIQFSLYQSIVRGRPFDSEWEGVAGKFGRDILFIFNMSLAGKLFSGIPSTKARIFIFICDKIFDPPPPKKKQKQKQKGGSEYWYRRQAGQDFSCFFF